MEGIMDDLIKKLRMIIRERPQAQCGHGPMLALGAVMLIFNVIAIVWMLK